MYSPSLRTFSRYKTCSYCGLATLAQSGLHAIREKAKKADYQEAQRQLQQQIDNAQGQQ